MKGRNMYYFFLPGELIHNSRFNNDTVIRNTFWIDSYVKKCL